MSETDEIVLEEQTLKEGVLEEDIYYDNHIIPEGAYFSIIPSKD
jgi:hypothetical protein